MNSLQQWLVFNIFLCVGQIFAYIVESTKYWHLEIVFLNIQDFWTLNKCLMRYFKLNWYGITSDNMNIYCIRFDTISSLNNLCMSNMQAWCWDVVFFYDLKAFFVADNVQYGRTVCSGQTLRVAWRSWPSPSRR